MNKDKLTLLLASLVTLVLGPGAGHLIVRMDLAEAGEIGVIEERLSRLVHPIHIKGEGHFSG